MKIYADMTTLHLEAAKIGGLEAYLLALRTTKKTYSEGLELAKRFVADNRGTIVTDGETGITELTLLGVKAFCFRPYAGIDLFYFEV